ncbi:putative leucine-rich repeat domain superfamily [Helianthus anomalus]
MLYVIPSHAVRNMQKLQVLTVASCESLIEVFQTYAINNNNGGGGGASSSTNNDEGNGGTDTTTSAIPRAENINVPQLSNLMKLKITSCFLLQHVFTFSTLESLIQLEELRIDNCEGMKVIVKEENGDQRKAVVFPHLKFLELDHLPNLEGFFLGMNEFQWPLLEEVSIRKCPRMMMFTCGRSTTPELKYIHTNLGKHSIECDLNFHVTTYVNQVYFFFFFLQDLIKKIISTKLRYSKNHLIG